MPAKRKKSGKLSKMSEEDRLLYEEQKRVAEEEMQKKKEDMLSQYLKKHQRRTFGQDTRTDHLTEINIVWSKAVEWDDESHDIFNSGLQDKLNKEEKASKFNLNKLNHQWRNIMREAKSRELKKDIEILSQTFERVVDRKDAVIKSLSKDLMEAEEQYSMALRSHIQNVDNLIDLQRQRLETLKKEYDEELEILKTEFDTERTFVIDQHCEEMNNIADILFAMEHNFTDRETDAKSEFQSMRDEIKNKNLEEKHALRVSLESKVDDLWQQFKQALQNYTETTDERKSSFETLKIKDEKSAREIEMQMRKLQRISDQISQLKSKMASNAKESEERNRKLRDEREKMLALFQDLKSQMNRLRDGEREKLTKLTLESNAASKEVKRHQEKGKQILKLAGICRKLETEEEKVLPFYASSLTKEEQEDVVSAELEPPSEPMSLVMHEYSSLENFWKRYNKVLLDKLALDKEKYTMLEENQQLRMLLKQYLDGISVNEEILSQVNPLFIVNNKTNVKLNVPVMDMRVRRQGQTVIEAAQIVKHIELPR